MVPEHPETFKEFMDKSKNKKVKNSIIHCFYEENEVNIEKMIHDVFEKAVNLNQFRLFIRMVQKEIILETDFRSFIEHCIFQDLVLFDKSSKVLSMGIDLLIEQKSPQN